MPQPKGWTEETNRARLEDLQWMADTGEHLTGAATRLRITPDALWKWCHRHGHLDLWQRLAHRDPDYHPEHAHHRTTNPKENHAA